MARYARPSDELARLASAVTASAAAPTYDPLNLISEDPAEPAKLTTNDGWFELTFDFPITVAAAALIYQYLDPGLEVRIQAHTSSSWTAPDFDQAITIPAKRLDGPDYQPWTTSPILIFDSPQTFAHWRVFIAEANSQPVHIGRLLLLGALRMVDLVDEGGTVVEETDTIDAIVQPTYLKVETIFVLEGPRRSLSTTFVSTDLDAGTTPVQQAAEFRALQQSAEGVAHPFPIIPFDDRPNDVWFVRFDSPERRRTHRVGGFQIWPISAKEVSRGLPFP